MRWQKILIRILKNKFYQKSDYTNTSSSCFFNFYLFAVILLYYTLYSITRSLVNPIKEISVNDYLAPDTMIGNYHSQDRGHKSEDDFSLSNWSLPRMNRKTS